MGGCQWLPWGSVSSGDDFGSVLCICGLDVRRPRTRDLGVRGSPWTETAGPGQAP